VDVLKLFSYEELTYTVLQKPVRVWYGDGFIVLGALRAIKLWGSLSIKTNLRQGKFFVDVIIYYNK
jgi:hypothetical protein